MFSGQASLSIDGWSDLDVMYNSDGKFWYGREWDYTLFPDFSLDPVKQLQLKVLGTGHLGTTLGQLYGYISQQYYLNYFVLIVFAYNLCAAL